MVARWAVTAVDVAACGAILTRHATAGARQCSTTAVTAKCVAGFTLTGAACGRSKKALMQTYHTVFLLSSFYLSLI